MSKGSKISLERRAFVIGAPALAATFAFACQRSGAVSAEKAKSHLPLMVKATASDVEEVRQGLPRGAERLVEYFAEGKFDDANPSLEALTNARNKVQDLRVTKSTFFALLTPTGDVIRSDQENDVLAGRNLFSVFPELRGALSGRYVETRGEMPELAKIRGRKDAQWVAAQPISREGKVLGVYVTGWSWSAYAYRLENQLRSAVRSALAEREKEPLVYVYVVVGSGVFGAPVSPDVNATKIAEQKFANKAAAPGAISAELEITGREFGVAFAGTPALGGKDIGVAVLRSET